MTYVEQLVAFWLAYWNAGYYNMGAHPSEFVMLGLSWLHEKVSK